MNNLKLSRTAYIWLVFLASLGSLSQAQTVFSDLPDSSSNELLYTFYLIGDAGDDTTNSMPTIRNLENKIKLSDPEKSGIIFLGDNIYKDGLRKKSSQHRFEDELRMNAQLDVAKYWDGDVFVIPGNHDWNHFGKGGLKAVKRQERYTNKYLNRKAAFLPKNGCPGPEVKKLAPGLVMIVFDSQWWLHQFERSSGHKDGCDCRNEDEFLELMKDLLKKYRNQNVIVTAHHPLISNGEHGGHFSVQDHIFPLTKVVPWLYAPLPGLGSIYPFYRKYIGHHQDIAHPHYTKLVNSLSKAMFEYDNIVYVSGHEHNLEYHHFETVHHIISGAGSKVTRVNQDKKMEFGMAQRGYARLLYYTNGDAWVEYYAVDNATGIEALVFRKKLYNKKVFKATNKNIVEKVSYSGKTTTVVADSNFVASKFKRFFFGDLNRDIWTKPIEVPFLDIHFEKGGLTPIKRGGGMQTISLRLKGGNGKMYVLRQVKKNSTFLIERGLRGTIAQDMLYDGMAASHPYAALAVSELADAAGVYHSDPKLVYVPKDPVLGDYLDEFGGSFCLFEILPDKDMSEHSAYGHSKKIISYPKAIEKLQENPNHIVDVDYTLRARLLDILIGDWDRHDDQWKWATFKEADKVIYRPIPRDRDQVFFDVDGVVMNIINRKWLLRKFQPFDEDIRDIAGTCFNARFFDRSFLTEANGYDWLKQARYLQSQITDKVIEDAVKQLPKEVFSLSGEKIIKTLKARRDKLNKFATDYYSILSKAVSITASLEDDFIEIDRNNDGSVEVSIYPRSKKGKKKKDERFYHRVFYPKETKEIRIYGLDGSDEYQLKGKTSKSILVRIIGGYEKDLIKNSSNVKGIRNYTKIYDTQSKNKIKGGTDTKVKLIKENEAYDYDRYDFKYNPALPIPVVGFNNTDGFILGLGAKYTRRGFKKEPYKYFHRFTASRTFKAEGFILNYDFSYVEAIGPFDFTGSLNVLRPDIYQFYVPEMSTDIIELAMNDHQVQLGLKFSSDDQSQNVEIGLKYRMIEFEDYPSILDYSWQLKSQAFIAPSFKYSYINLDNKLNPNRGILLSFAGSWNKSLENETVDYFNLNSEFGLFVPLNWTKKQTTLALRTGFSGVYGKHTFYQANYIDGTKNFRGIKRNKYEAESFLYQNIDLRFSLIKVKTYVVPFDLGFLSHFDLIHTENSNSFATGFQYSFGGGVFVSILDYFMLQGTYSVSENGNMLTVGTRFLF